ncbi:Rieske (2Fe-2S) protein [Streptomyces neyagawaensis]|uniref:Rieske (2Fe-2S) protein n=1 Tax=Streptomyces neyagawaensis TaxID=42238 RepID=UPI001F0A7E18|nr:Rieske (2Fe-2S) protein [Streptomyces neyagawaensis]MCL6738429.1 Rieske (2Fe-2S) protein [Streptomyces neyagawaensis]MDE1688052.1 Rieske (2Fe-2S) protein [Streptomyces neyagawaensis]
MQPGEGDFRAFSAFCPHRGCMVKSIGDSAIRCPCHGSSFDLADGSVLGGPATTGLIPKPLQIRQGRIEIPADE